ncbi:MAG: thiamine-binding protein [Ferruginibacter sp.]|nr:thiamine-binding protein [Ferruginibacter sp.]
MHNYIVNASLQIIPIVQDRHPYEWVDEAITIIQQSTVKYEVGAFSTTLEGNYADVMKVINDVNEYLLQKGCAEWISNIQVQIRSRGDITGDEKTAKFVTHPALDPD